MRDVAGDGQHQIVLVGSANWAGAAIGDYVNLVGVRDNVMGASLGIDGAWKVANIATTSLTLVNIPGGSPTVADFAHSAPQREEAPAPEERAELVSIMHELERTRPQDAEIIQHRLRGRRWREISQQMGVSEEALRQRWS